MTCTIELGAEAGEDAVALELLDHLATVLGTGLRAARRCERLLHRLGAGPGEVVALDDPIGDVTSARLTDHPTDEEGQRKQPGQRARGEGDRAIEPRDLLEAADDAEGEGGPRP